MNGKNRFCRFRLAATALSRLPWSAAQSDLVSVGITVRDLAHAVGVGFPLHGVESPIGYLRDDSIEVIDEDGDSVANGQRPMLRIRARC